MLPTTPPYKAAASPSMGRLRATSLHTSLSYHPVSLPEFNTKRDCVFKIITLVFLAFQLIYNYK